MIFILLWHISFLMREKENGTPVCTDSSEILNAPGDPAFQDALDRCIETGYGKRECERTLHKKTNSFIWTKAAIIERYYFVKRAYKKIMTPKKKYKAAFDLASQGMDRDKIASKLGIAKGEIALILDLDRTKNESH